MRLIILVSQCLLVTVVLAETCFEMSPRGDVFKLVGQDVQVNCSLKVLENDTKCQDGYDFNKTTIKKGSKDLSPDLFSYVDHENTLVMKLQNVTFEDDGFYNCFNGGRSIIQSTVILRVGVPPGAPENISCISRNFNDLSCSFDLSKRITNIPSRTTVQLKTNQDWQSFPEPNIECEKGSACYLRLDSRKEAPSDFTFMRTVKYEFRITELNRLGSNSTDIVIGQSQSIVKPDPVEDLDFSYTNFSRLVSLSWRCTKDLTYSTDSTWISMDYKIVLTSLWDNRELLVKNRTTASVKYNIDDLKPFTSYHVNVLAKPSAAVLEMYWSDSGDPVTFVTHSEVSEHAVSTTPGSYMVTDHDRLVIYWKDPARRYWFGEITGHKITLEKVVLSDSITDKIGDTDQGRVAKNYFEIYGTQVKTEAIKGVSTFGVLNTNLNKENSYKVNIVLINRAGVSNNRSELIVPNWSIAKALRPELVFAETTNSSVYISWYMDRLYCNDVTSVTYYWCMINPTKPFNNSHVECLDELNWETFNMSYGCEGILGREILNITDQSNMIYSVSVQTSGQISGGMVSEKFRFSKNHVPDVPLYTISADGTSLRVEILYGDYHVSKGGRPDNYSIDYAECQADQRCNSYISKRNFIANFHNPVYAVKNLKHGTQYEVRVSSINSAGRSKYGKPFLISIDEDANVVIAKVLGGSAAATLCIIIVIVVCLGRKRFQRMKKQNPITIPEPVETTAMLGNDGDKNYQNNDMDQESDYRDSGRGSDSLGSTYKEEETEETSLGSNKSDGSANLEALATKSVEHCNIAKENVSYERNNRSLRKSEVNRIEIDQRFPDCSDTNIDKNTFLDEVVSVCVENCTAQYGKPSKPMDRPHLLGSVRSSDYISKPIEERKQTDQPEYLPFSNAVHIKGTQGQSSNCADYQKAVPKNENYRRNEEYLPMTRDLQRGNIDRDSILGTTREIREIKTMLDQESDCTDSQKAALNNDCNQRSKECLPLSRDWRRDECLSDSDRESSLESTHETSEVQGVQVCSDYLKAIPNNNFNPRNEDCLVNIREPQREEYQSDRSRDSFRGPAQETSEINGMEAKLPVCTDHPTAALTNDYKQRNEEFLPMMKELQREEYSSDSKRGNFAGPTQKTKRSEDDSYCANTSVNKDNIHDEQCASVSDKLLNGNLKETVDNGSVNNELKQIQSAGYVFTTDVSSVVRSERTPNDANGVDTNIGMKPLQSLSIEDYVLTMDVVSTQLPGVQYDS